MQLAALARCHHNFLLWLVTVVALILPSSHWAFGQESIESYRPDVADDRAWPEGYIAICVVARNQHRELREWLMYHEYIGVDKVSQSVCQMSWIHGCCCGLLSGYRTKAPAC